MKAEQEKSSEFDDDLPGKMGKNNQGVSGIFKLSLNYFPEFVAGRFPVDPKPAVLRAVSFNDLLAINLTVSTF